ncbi:hypothetical protein MOO45_06805 [Bombilactobacillus folatiphilus]|uniref:Uncharacterized protein n=1 Tax=Bombilactobacillus folatiphilus TaxID=2923362 RepID=A0ABY4P8G8_9LACO|nr:hypothetical protein [Bombilactobacillus folatiphilus]UQS81896.1 hypothetical protein MOO45_06805 [Bombilactobacillus folatiphilus]
MKRSVYIKPYFFGVIVDIVLLLLKYYLNFDYTSNGMSSALDSIVGFLSIIIGFYTAFYGIIISEMKSSLMKKLMDSKDKDELPKLLKRCIGYSFFSLILTIIFQLLIYYKNRIVLLFYFLWAFILVVCITYAYIVAQLSIFLIFYGEKKPKKKKKFDN